MSNQSVTYELPIDIIEKLLCSQCNAYVSCGPVFGKSDGSAICGRCSSAENAKFTRLILYETAMSQFTFPCRYKAQGCDKRVVFGDIKHEDGCPYHTFTCPGAVYDTCKQSVSVHEIRKHFEQAHKHLIMKENKFKIDLGQSLYCNFLMTEDNITFIIQCLYQYYTKNLYLTVNYISESENQICHKLGFINEADPDCVVFLPEHKSNCFKPRSFTNRQPHNNVLLGKYLPAINNPECIFVNVVILLRSLESPVPSTKSEMPKCLFIDRDSSVNKDMEHKAVTNFNALERYRCNICKEFVVPPFYVQGRITPIIYLCNVCRRSCNGLRLATESIPSFPCRWRGCAFVGNESNIQNHIQNCNFRVYVCPVSSICQESFYIARNSTAHINHMNKHNAEYIQNPHNIIINLFSTDSLTKTYYTVIDNVVVAFECKIWDKYCWTLKSNRNEYTCEVYFEHDHCRFKSKTYSKIGSIDFASSKIEEEFPECFKACRRISAVLTVKTFTD